MSSILKNFNLKLGFGKLVKTDNKILDSVCRLLKEKTSKKRSFEWKDERFWPDDKAGVSTVSQFFTIGNSINFRYWWLDEQGVFNYCNGNKGGISTSGSNYMWRALKLCCEEETFPILDAESLSKIKLSEVRHIFKDDEGYDIMPAMKERWRNLQDLGKKLTEYWNGNFYHLIKEIKNSLFNFVQYSRQFRAFDDPLCKMTMVNALMHKGRGITKFDISIFPAIDYQLLKQEMRIGIIQIDDTIKGKIIEKKLLNFEEARELRNSGLYAFLEMMQKTLIEGDVIDNIFWMNKNICKTEKPLCEKCIFNKVCSKHIEYGIPLEVTRYY